MFLDDLKSFLTTFKKRPRRTWGLTKSWSRQRESNPQPTVYKTVALPLSHAGELVHNSGYALKMLGSNFSTFAKVFLAPSDQYDLLRSYAGIVAHHWHFHTLS